MSDQCEMSGQSYMSGGAADINGMRALCEARLLHTSSSANNEKPMKGDLCTYFLMVPTHQRGSYVPRSIRIIGRN